MRGLTLLLMLFLLSAGARAQSAIPEPVLTLGRGEIVSAAWSPDGESVWISTTAGTWQLDAHLQEIAAYPHITYAALSPDGAHLAGTSPDGYVAVWDVATGNQVSLLSAKARMNTVPLWSANSHRFVFHGESNRGGVPYVMMYNQTNQPVLLMPGTVSHWAWSARGMYVAVYDSILRRAAVFSSNGDPIQLENADNLLDLSPDGDGTHLLWRGDSELTYTTIGDGSEQRKWSIPDGRSLDISRNPLCANSCSYTSSGRYAAFDRGFNNILRVIDLEAQIPIFDFAAKEGYPDNPSWRPDSVRLAANILIEPVGQMKGIIVLDRETGEVIWQRNDAGILPVDLLWSPNGIRIFAYDNGGRMVVIDGDSGDIVARADNLFNATVVAFDSNAMRLAVVDGGGSIRTVEIASGEIASEWLRSGKFVAQVMWQPNGDIVAIHDQLRFRENGEVTLWDIGGNTQTAVPGTQSDGGLHDGARGIDWNEDGSLLAIALVDTVKLYGHDDEELVIPPPGNGDAPLSAFEVRWMPSGSLVAMYYTCCHGPLLLVDVLTDDTGAAWDRVWGIAPDNRVVATQQGYKQVGEQVLPGLFVNPNALDGRNMRIEMQGASDQFNHYWISPSTEKVAAVNGNGGGMIWESASGAPLQFLSNVADLIWTPDDSTLAILQRNGSVWLQDSDGLRLLWSPPLPVESPGTLVWSGDGSTLAHVQDGVLRVWKP
ncbi:MAG: hypothetical protein IPK52_08135 [Chloroflexi bacterium]|nr:hypothetical protein [Chloroflexota bacterium]